MASEQNTRKYFYYYQHDSKISNCQFPSHITSAKHVAKYRTGKTDLGIIFSSNNSSFNMFSFSSFLPPPLEITGLSDEN